jgi:hypothetical protein
VLDVCGRLLARWREGGEGTDRADAGVAAVLVDFLHRSLGSQQQKEQLLLPPLVLGAEGVDEQEAEEEEQERPGNTSPRSGEGSSRSSGSGSGSNTGGGDRAASWGAVLRFAHTLGGPHLLAWLVMESALPWERLPKARATACRLLLSTKGADTDTQPAIQALLLTLALHDLAAAVASPAATVTLDSAGGVAWLELPRVGALLTQATRLADSLGDGEAAEEAVTQACLRAAPAVVKHLVLQDVPLVVKGPFFPYLQDKWPRALARVLAAVVVQPELSGSEFLFETPQILRLLGPWGLGLAQEMGRFLAKNEKLLLATGPADGGAADAAPASSSSSSSTTTTTTTTTTSRASAASPVPSALAAFRSPSMGEEMEGFKDSGPSKALVHAFLAARFELDRKGDATGAQAQRQESGCACPDAFPWRQLLVAELLGLDLDALEGEEEAGEAGLDGSGPNSHSEEEEEGNAKGGAAAAAWLLQLAGALPCGEDNTVVRRLALLLLASPTPTTVWDWEWVLRWLLPRLNLNANATSNKGPAALAAARLVKAICLAQAGGRRLVGEAVELLFALLAEAGCQGEGALDVVMGFGFAFFGGGEPASERWRLVLAKAGGSDGESAKHPGGLYEGLLRRLAQALPARALVQAIPDDADVDQLLALMESGRFLSMRGGVAQ